MVAHLEELRRTLYRRLAAMDAALQAHLPAQATYLRPEAGYFFWLQLPEPVDTAAFLPVARAAGVGFQPGPVFSTTGQLRNYLRLSFAFYDEATASAAVATLGNGLAELIGDERGQRVADPR
jgi:DNA-binding transcriptional MocR family regulator